MRRRLNLHCCCETVHHHCHYCYCHCHFVDIHHLLCQVAVCELLVADAKLHVPVHFMTHGEVDEETLTYSSRRLNTSAATAHVTAAYAPVVQPNPAHKAPPQKMSATLQPFSPLPRTGVSSNSSGLSQAFAAEVASPSSSIQSISEPATPVTEPSTTPVKTAKSPAGKK